MEFGSIQAFTMQYALMILPTMVDGWTVKEWSRCACMDMGKNQVTVTGTMDAKALPERLRKKLRRPVDVVAPGKEKDGKEKDGKEGGGKDGKDAATKARSWRRGRPPSTSSSR